MIDIIIPVLGRPGQVTDVAVSARLNTEVDFELTFVCSGSDREGYRAACAMHAAVLCLAEEPGRGDFAKKINLGFSENERPFAFLGATDLKFYPGWDHAALRVAEETGAGVIGTDDLGNGLVRQGKHSTHSLVRRSYIEAQGGTFDEEPGVVYAECYDHQCVDNELVFVAQERGQWAFARGAQVEHLHPLWRKSPMDATYRKALAQGRQDIVLFGSRRADWTARQRRTRVSA